MESSPLLGALVTPELRREQIGAAAASASKDALAARAIVDAASIGNAAAEEFVAESTSRLAAAAIHQDRADRLREKAADASVAGYARLAAFGADAALAEDTEAGKLEESVTRAVRSSYGAAPFYVSPREAQLWKQSDALQSMTQAQVEKAMTNMLAKQMAEAENYGADDDEVGEVDSGVTERLAAVAEVFGGDASLVFGEDALGSIFKVFKISKEKLEKRLARKRERLAKLAEKEDEGKKGLFLQARIKGLKKSIAKIKDKLAKIAEAEGKVRTASVDEASTKSAEAAAMKDLESLDLDEDDDSDLDDELGADADVLGADADVLGEDEIGEDEIGRRMRPGRRKALRRRGRGDGWQAQQPAAEEASSEEESFDEEGSESEEEYGSEAQDELAAAKMALQIAEQGFRSGQVSATEVRAATQRFLRAQQAAGQEDAMGRRPWRRRGFRRGRGGRGWGRGGMGPVIVEASPEVLEVIEEDDDEDVLGSEDGLGAGSQPVAHASSSFVAFFDEKADRLGAASEDVEDSIALGGDEDAQVGGFFDTISDFLSSLFEAGGAKAAARKPFTPGVREARTTYRETAKERRQAGKQAWRASRRGDAIDSPEDIEFAPSKASQSSAAGPLPAGAWRGSGGYAYELLPGGVGIRVVAGPTSRGAIFKAGTEAYRNALAERGRFGAGSQPIASTVMDVNYGGEDADVLGEDEMGEDEMGEDADVLGEDEVGEDEVLGAEASLGWWYRRRPQVRRSWYVRRPLFVRHRSFGEDETVGAEGPLESVLRATPGERAAAAARFADRALKPVFDRLAPDEDDLEEDGDDADLLGGL